MIRAGMHMKAAGEAMRPGTFIKDMLQGYRKGRSYTLMYGSMGRREPDCTNFSVQERQHGLSRCLRSKK